MDYYAFFGYLILGAVPLASAVAKNTGLNGSSESAFMQTIIIFLKILLNYVMARSVLLFPHIALGGEIEWAAAWRDTAGHFFVIAFIYGTISTLPSYIISNLMIRYISSVEMNIYFVFPLQAGIKLFLVMLGNSALAWIYLKFARKILDFRKSGSRMLCDDAG